MELQSYIEKLRPYSTCNISDALQELKHLDGGFIPNISLWSPKRQEGSTKLIGPAYTVKFVLSSETEAPRLPQHYIDTVPSGHVVFISAPQGVENACYGGLMTRRARALGAIGTVVDGNIRDLEEQRALEYPVFAKGVSTPSYLEVARPSETNVPLSLHSGRCTVGPGDIIVGDLNGLVCIPKQLVPEVAEVVQRLAKADAKVEADIDNGGQFSIASKKHRGLK